MLSDVDPETVTTSVTTIASQGVLGALLIIVGVFAWSKDRELKTEREARIADAKSYTELALKLQAQVIDAVNKLADILDEMKKLMQRGAGAG
jgi:hypothetical protein